MDLNISKGLNRPSFNVAKQSLTYALCDKINPLINTYTIFALRFETYFTINVFMGNRMQWEASINSIKLDVLNKYLK